MTSSRVALNLIVIILILSTARALNLIKNNNNNIQQECQETYWGNRGEVCDNDKRKCKNFYLCKGGVCTYSNIGTACEKNEDCFLGGDTSEMITCANKVCTKKKFNGFECSSNGECYHDNCEVGKCVGKKLGETCNPQSPVECDKGLYCSLSQTKCVEQLKPDAPCNDYYIPPQGLQDGSNFNVICPGGYKCMGEPGHKSCKKFKDGEEGKDCDERYDGDDQCKYGLHCNPSTKKCSSERSLAPSFECKGFERNCSVEEHEVCACTLAPVPRPEDLLPKKEDIKSVCIPTINRHCDLFGALTRWRDCALENNCPFDFDPEKAFLVDSLEEKSCMGKYCKNIAKDYLCCAHEPYRRQKHSPVSVGPLGCPSGISPVGIFFLVVFVIVIIGLVIGLGVGVLVYVIKMKKKESFDTLE